MWSELRNGRRSGGGGRTVNKEAGQKRPGDFAFIYPRPPLRDSTKEMLAKQTTKTKPSDSDSHQRVQCRFLRSQPRRIGLGSPLGRDPLRIDFTLRQREKHSRFRSCS